MAVTRITVHAVEIEDKPGSLYKLLSQVAAENVDLLCATACSCGGKGMAYISAKDAEALKAAAAKAGIQASEMAGFIVSGDDKVGAAAEALKGVAEAQVNGVAGAAMVCDSTYQMLLIVNASDVEAAQKALSA